MGGALSAKKKEEFFEKARACAAERGGACLSEKYTHSLAPMLWRCAKGHKFTATYNSVRHCRSWCPYCSGRTGKGASLTLAQKEEFLEKARAYAAEHGGVCLSEAYVNYQTQMLWRCAKGHEFSATYNNSLSGRCWCPFCAGRAGKKSKQKNRFKTNGLDFVRFSRILEAQSASAASSK